MKYARDSFFQGAVGSIPLLLGVMPFGLVTGAMTMRAGVGALDGQGMAAAVFAGASQLAVLQLMLDDATVTVMLLTGVVINLRMLMYSAYVAPHFRLEKTRWKVLIGYLLTDQAFALCVPRIESGAWGKELRWFYLGAGLTIWAGWQLTFAVGAQLGVVVPQEWGIEFLIPLMFLAMVVPGLGDRASLLAACTAAVLSFLLRGMPLNLGLLIASGCGVVAGLMMERRGE